jgi:hypothetical protein
LYPVAILPIKESYIVKRTKVFSVVALALLAVGITSCQSPSTSLIPVFQNADDIEAISPKDGVSFSFLPTLTSAVVEGAELYNFQISTDSQFSDIVHDRDDIAINTYLIESITELSGFWRVRARKNGEWGAWSESRNIALNSGISPMISTGTTSDLTPRLDWNEVDDAVSYDVRISTEAGTIDQQTYFNITHSSYQIVAPMSSGDSLFWQVRSVYENTSISAWSELQSFIVIIGVPITPNPPNGAVMPSNFWLVSWADVDYIGRYEIRHSDDLDTLSAQPIYSRTTNQYMIGTGHDGTPILASYELGDSIFWQVRAVNYDGEVGTWSEIWNIEIAYQIGENGPAGGIVFYDKGSYSSGWRFMEVSPYNLSEGTVWGGYRYYVGNASGTAIGDGASNTAAIVATFGSNEPYQSRSNYAAKLCADLVYGGESDWFLPSKDELGVIVSERVAVGLTNGWWWSSSTSLFTTDAWYWRWYPTDPNLERKDNARVRAVRSF